MERLHYITKIDRYEKISYNIMPPYVIYLPLIVMLCTSNRTQSNREYTLQLHYNCMQCLVHHGLHLYQSGISVTGHTIRNHTSKCYQPPSLLLQPGLVLFIETTGSSSIISIATIVTTRSYSRLLVWTHYKLNLKLE